MAEISELKDWHENPSFLIYKDWEPVFNSLSDSDLAMLFRSLIAYAARGEIPKFKDNGLNIAFMFFSKSIERDGIKWAQTCKVRSDARKKHSNVTNVTNVNKCHQMSQMSQMSTNATDIDTDKDKVRERVKDKDKDRGREKEKDKVTDTDPQPAKSRKRQKLNVQHYGDYYNVVLTDEQLLSLVETYGKNKTTEYIQRLDEYIQQSGKKYNDCFLVIKKWINEDCTSLDNYAVVDTQSAVDAVECVKK